VDRVRRAQAGDREAFDELHEENVGRVYAVCLRMTADPVRAEQLTQDAFVRAWLTLHSFRAESAFSTWLHRLAVNTVLMDMRSQRRREDRVLPVEDPAFFEQAARDAGSETRMDLERGIASLPERARHILVLYDIEGYAQQEIAEMLDIAVGTVKAQLHRARQLLRTRLSQ
jgi:RNA polymerase sigma-70 factor, ECF subfamily